MTPQQEGYLIATVKDTHALVKDVQEKQNARETVCVQHGERIAKLESRCGVIAMLFGAVMGILGGFIGGGAK